MTSGGGPVVDRGEQAHDDPRVMRSRAALLDAARNAFAEHGYTDTSVDDIAARAGLAKRTVYNIYGDKETLFLAAIGESIAIAEAFAGTVTARVADMTDPWTELPSIAVRLASEVLLGPVVPLRRLIARESFHFPDLAAEYRDKAPESVLRALAGGFEAASRRGVLAIEDPELAAEHFAYLVMGAELDRRMLGDTTSAERVERRARSGVTVFLRAYGVPPSK